MSSTDTEFFYRSQANTQARAREAVPLEQRHRKELSDAEVFTLAAMKWLKSLRDEFPGRIQGADDQMDMLAARVSAVLLGGM
jgi:hypothetical protein